ncbi:MAG: hypothetical protein ABSA97_01305 [Verrucomicrobiia bacterium]
MNKQTQPLVISRVTGHRHHTSNFAAAIVVADFQCGKPKLLLGANYVAARWLSLL